MEIDTQITYNIIEDSVPSFNKKENVEKVVSKQSSQENIKRPERKQAKEVEKIAIQEKNPQPKVEEQGSEDNKPVEKDKDIANSHSSSVIDNSATIQTEGTKLQFKVVENVDPNTGIKTKEMVVFLLNAETDEVIRRVPPEEVEDSSTGSFLDKVG